VYNQLLVTFRFLLPTAYLVSSALGPYLPSLMPRLGIGEQWHTIVATAWLIPRSACFGLLGFWPGWHGRWWPAIAGVVGLLGGFAGCVASGMVAPPGGDTMLPVAMLLASLCVFGMGMGVIYSGAIYYAMEVGKAEVDAGGTHEALIGVGYAAGPLCGLIAAGAVERRWLGPSMFDPVVLGSVGLVSLGVCVVVMRSVVRNGRAGAVEQPDR
jgi:MFS family permease